MFEADGVVATTLQWMSNELPMAARVLSVGFPYALNPDLMTLSVRAFRGNVVAAARTAVLPGQPRIYELQFQCPRGLSGAPLMFESSRLLSAGVIVGNATTQMLVLSDREVFTEGGYYRCREIRNGLPSKQGLCCRCTSSSSARL